MKRDQQPPTITHPDKVLFPDDGITKGELAAYYEMVAPLLVPQIRGRPLTMERYGVRDVEKLLHLPRSTVRALVEAGFVSPARGPRTPAG